MAQNTYFQFSNSSLSNYLKDKSEISNILGGDHSEWTVNEVGDGNLNFIYLVKGSKGSVIVKQAVPYIRLIGESWPLTRTRAFFESQALLEEAKYCPNHVPKVFLYDDNLSTIVMQYLENYIILRKGLIQGIVYPHLSEHISTFLSNTLFFTSSLYLSTEEKKKKVAIFNGNFALCQVTEQVIFTEPYIHAKNNRWTSPELDDDVKSIQSDANLKVAVSKLKLQFQESTEALIHGDFHTGSVMVSNDSTFAIDPEFAFYGPMGFDIGAIISNFFLSYFSQDGHGIDGSRKQYKNWLVEQVDSIWNLFCKKFVALWNTQHKGDVYSPSFLGEEGTKKAQEQHLKKLLSDSLGFAAAKMIRRIVGVAHVADLESISNREMKVKCERSALHFAKFLLLNSESFHSISQVTSKLAEY